MTNSTPRATVAVVGGGLAGLAAGCALADTGFRVQLYERRPYLGGRASSYQHPATGEVVDNCQHVLLGCCTNLIDFYRRIGVLDQIRWFDQYLFVEPGGRQSTLKASSLPPPFHLAPSFLRSSALPSRDKAAIARAMMAIVTRLPSDDGQQNFLDWLKLRGQTGDAIERFWKPVLVSALNEDLDRVSVYYGAQVFRESFLKSVEAGKIGLPTVPLTELYGAADDYIRARSGEVHLRGAVDSFSPELDNVRLCVGGQEVTADFAVLALPYQVTASVLPQTAESEPIRNSVAALQSSPITGIHLWFDRQITDLEYAVLLDRTIQWMFHKSKFLKRSEDATGSYVELVVSASKTLVDKSKNEIVELAIRELHEFFPAAREAKVVKSTVIKEVHASYSPVPGVDRLRPPNVTAWPRVFLSGDWTATGWPATMEGAVRSGYLAAEALARAAGQRRVSFLQPDLPAKGFMRFGSGSV
ncbi:MAG TPA: hydroxysqualene dehydroxylase HpnE [Terriglobales bacterium]|nr:hydroxysqualene dehydroxylase HpnE [Terriglobales bacterium]